MSVVNQNHSGEWHVVLSPNARKKARSRREAACSGVAFLRSIDVHVSLAQIIRFSPRFPRKARRNFHGTRAVPDGASTTEHCSVKRSIDALMGHAPKRECNQDADQRRHDLE